MKKDDTKLGKPGSKENFRLIAVRPLKGCDVKYRKVLQEGQEYVFYNEYELIRKHPNDIHSEIEEIRYTPSVPQDFYDVNGINGKINVSVSAVVGKNGSGKSSLVDLLIAAIYLLSISEGTLKGSLKSKRVIDLSSLIRVEVFYQIANQCFKLKIGFKSTEKDWCQIVPIHSNLPQEQGQSASEDLGLGDNFFYSILLNYSSYALNSKEIGGWIEELFVKNDAYQTPIVMNPMRRNGNFDINDENYLVHGRLLSILLTTEDPSAVADPRQQESINPRYLTSEKLAHSLIIKPDSKKTNANVALDQSLRTEYESHFPESWKKDPQRENTTYDDEARKYVLGKLKSMATKYGPYKKFIVNGNIINHKIFLEIL